MHKYIHTLHSSKEEQLNLLNNIIEHMQLMTDILNKQYICIKY